MISQLRKIWPWDGPMSHHEGRTLIATNKVYSYIGRCVRCGDEIKIKTTAENDKICVECQYKLPRKAAR